MELKDWIDSLANESPDPNESPKHVFSNYSEFKEIASGGEYVVYSVKKKDLSGHLAMKILKEAQFDPLADVTTTPKVTDEVKRKFLKEMNIWNEAYTKAPDSVVAPLDCNLYPVPWAVMELGTENLRDALKVKDSSKAVDRKEFINILVNVLNSLDTLHEAKIVHRDLKPENILRVDNYWKFIDFGISGIDGRTKTRDRIQGTPDYMSPEEASGSTHIDSRTDIWQIGIMLYKFVTHEEPYPGIDDNNRLVQIALGPIGMRQDQIDRKIPRDYRRILEKALSIDLAYRYRTAREFAQDLNGLNVSDVFRDALNAYAGRELKRGKHEYGVPNYRKALELCEKGISQGFECGILKCIILAEARVPEKGSAPKQYREADRLYAGISRQVPPTFFQDYDGDIQWMGGMVNRLGLGMDEPDQKEADRLLQLSSKSGSVLGCYARYTADHSKIRDLDVAADAGYLPAMLDYIDTGEDPPRLAEVYHNIELTATQSPGDGDLQYIMGYICLKCGGPIKKNADDAVRKLQKACDLGHSGAMFLLGSMLYDGYGSGSDAKEPDKQAGLKYLKQADTAGNPDASLKLARHYETEGQVDTAKAYYMSAADGGNADALYWVASNTDMPAEKAIRFMKDAAAGGSQAAKDYLLINAEWATWASAAESGDPEALCRLARGYETGMDPNDRRPNFEKAEAFYVRSKTPEANYYLGMMRLEGRTGKPDREGARKLFEKSSQSGNKDAAYRLCLMYDEDHDYLEAYRLAQSASGMGSDEALMYLDGRESVADILYGARSDPVKMYEYGLLLQSGKDALIARDPAMAEKAFRESGTAEAYFALGMMYDAGDGVAKSYPDAADMFRRALDAGHAEAGYRLGLMHLDGRAGEKDDTAARNVFIEAANLGNADAAWELCRLYDVRLNYTKAYGYAKKAAELGNAEAASYVSARSGISGILESDLSDPAALFAYGSLLQAGMGNLVKKNLERASSAFKKSAEGGNADALYALGMMHETGEGADQSYIDAYELISKAADLGNEDAQQYISDRADVGDILANARNDPEAAYRLGRLLETGSHDCIPRDYVGAVRNYSRHGDKATPSSHYRLGVIYRNGAKGVKANRKKAAEELKMAADAGHRAAMYTLGADNDPVYFQKALEAGHPLALYTEAMKYEDAGDKGTAEKMYRRCVRSAADGDDDKEKVAEAKKDARKRLGRLVYKSSRRKSAPFLGIVFLFSALLYVSCSLSIIPDILFSGTGLSKLTPFALMVTVTSGVVFLCSLAGPAPVSVAVCGLLDTVMGAVLLLDSMEIVSKGYTLQFLGSPDLFVPVAAVVFIIVPLLVAVRSLVKHMGAGKAPKETASSGEESSA